MAAIYFIRHGQASFGKENYDELSPLGEKQSYVLGEGLAKRGITFDKVIQGGLVRHHQTAEHCLNGIGAKEDDIELEIDMRFSEYNHTEVIARHRPDLETHHAMAAYLSTQPSPRKAFQDLFAEAIQRWVSGDFNHEYSESWAEFQQRCANGMNDICKSDAKSIAVFTSGGAISMVMQQLLELNDQQAIKISWSVVNASVTKVLFKDNRVSLNYFNDFSYFEQVDPTLITYR
ncbi:MAG: phosphoglycerate mutase family protein [Pseudomonadales bacterium]|nr:phosphoglycerate mutase family protein [Pseudomonadales bacterium]